MARRALRDDALVVRFGRMRTASLEVAVQRCLVVRGYYGLSFFGDNGLTLDDIAHTAALPHSWLCVSTYGSIRREGFTVRREGRRNHLVLRFDGAPPTDALERLIRLFDGPLLNPHPFREEDRR